MPLLLLLGRYWQNDVRDLMGMERLGAWEWGVILIVTVVIALLILLVARLVRGFARVVRTDEDPRRCGS